MGIDINCLGASAQAQVRKELERRERERKTAPYKRRLNVTMQDQKMGSMLEQRYYETYIWPLIITGKVVSCECQKTFELLPASEYCGLKLPAAHYTPDFLLTYEDGTVEAIETKNATIKKLQREYIYRRRLFIDLIARPRGWRFTEYVQSNDIKKL